MVEELDRATVTAPSGALVSTLLAAAAIGTLQIGVAVSLAALIFSGPLSDGAGRASAGFILATAIMLVIIGLRSRVMPVIGGVQDTAAIVAAAVAASIAAETAPDDRVPTVLVMLAITGLGTAAASFVIGRYGLGVVVRFLPYPVISGFVAGTGWLLFRGGIEVMIDRPLELSGLGEILAWSTSRYLLAGLALGLFMLFCVLKNITSVAISAAILFSAVAFHVIGLTGWDLATLEDNGWLIGPFPEGGGWQPVGPSDFAATDWGVVAGHWAGIGAVIAVSVVGAMLNLSGIEELVDSEVDVDHELQLIGVANVPIAVGGGLISYHLLGDTALAEKLGVRSRATPLAIAGAAALLFIFGYDLIALMPRTVAGGVLVGIGLTVLAGWVNGPIRGMNRLDAGVSTVILLIIGAAGILTGVGVGLVVATLFFVVRYSRIDPVRHVVDAAGRSNVDRPVPERRILRSVREEIISVELQGYLFFGSIDRLRTSVMSRRIPPEPTEVGADAPRPMRFLLLDFTRVTGIDLTAATGVRALGKRLQSNGTDVVWSGLTPAKHAELLDADLDPNRIFTDFDHAVAWCEEQLLDEVRSDTTASDLQPSRPSELVELFETLPTRTLSVGEILIDPTETNRDLYLVDSGRLSAWTVLEDGRRARLRQISAGAVIGELAFCTGARRTAQVIADTDAQITVLTRSAFAELRQDQPEQALQVQEFLLRRLSFRLADTSSLVRDLMR